MKHARAFFLYFLLFNLCFLGLQSLLLYSQNGSFVSSISLPEIAWIQILTTLGIHLILYALLSLLQTYLLLGILKRPWHYFSSDQWLMIIWGLCVSAILSANAYYFPLSVFSKILSPPLSASFMLIILSVSGLALGLLLLNNLLSRHGIYLLVVALPVILFCMLKNMNTPPNEFIVQNKPNVIILGIDSLSPESVNTQSMPFFSQLLADSTQFTNSISTLARTYPAWSSILTGLYAKHHHAEENLVAKDTVKSQASIAWLLRDSGYNTIFATDDRRFNSIGKEFGFNKIIGPKLGVNDVLLGSFNDFPLSNLLINFRFSALLFPFNYSSRASFFSYYPRTFNEELQNELQSESHKTPVFLAVHFTLPHWPYAWAESLPEQVQNEFSIEKRDYLYQQSLLKVDKQFQSFFTYLQQQHYFDNCFLILLSDHGEVLYYPGSRLTSYKNYQGTLPSRFAKYLNRHTATTLNKSAGHGSDILSPKQYHNVLAFRIYKNDQQTTPNQIIQTRISLMDLTPTILDFLHIKNKQKMDGVSLLGAILNPLHALAPRIFFIESGMFPNQLLSKKKTIEIGARFYNVNPMSGELEIKPEKMDAINHQKLYGVISGDWVLALYPDKKNYIPVIQNLSTGNWIDDLHSDFAKTTPANQMYQQMQKFYGTQLFLPLP